MSGFQRDLRPPMRATAQGGPAAATGQQPSLWQRLGAMVGSGQEQTPTLILAGLGGGPGQGAAGQQGLKQFPGYDQDWHQSNDALIKRVVAAFNAEKGLTPQDPDYMDPNLAKAWALQESGGHQDIFTGGDMMQVNNPGDWAKEKSWFGLKKGEKLDPEKSLRTALEWAWYKGEVTKATKNGEVDPGWHPTQRGTQAFPGYESRFTGWENGLTNYNGGGVNDYWADIDRRNDRGRMPAPDPLSSFEDGRPRVA